MNIFVTNLSTGIDSHSLEVLFHRFGDVGDASIWVDYEEESLRFAIVEMPDDNEGARAVRKLHRKNFSGKRLWVEKAPEAFAEMLSLCGEAPQILRTHDRGLADDDDRQDL